MLQIALICLRAVCCRSTVCRRCSADASETYAVQAIVIRRSPLYRRVPRALPDTLLVLVLVSAGGSPRPGEPGSPPDVRFVGRYVHDGLPCRGRKRRLDVRGDGYVR